MSAEDPNPSGNPRLDPKAWRELQELLARALELDGSEHERFLAALALEDAGKARVLAELLAADAQASILESGVAELPSSAFPSEVGASAASRASDALHLGGGVVGAWRLLHPIGKGGSGVVYAAERADGQFTQQVAVKILRRSVDAELRPRFLRERQLLARLEHPAIVRLLDGGITDEGTPWFAMERVEGVSIRDFVKSKSLDIASTLKLFLEVCAAVDFAHRNLVVHRDLKPGNVLVTAEGRVKLLDFGIAKVLDDEMEGQATRAEVRLMTPEYAAPEQILGEPSTTATDVYALGVILYELFTGSLPHRRERTTAAGLADEVSRETTSAPSTRVLERAAGPGPESRRKARALQGDLDSIVLKALRRDPRDRYPSAAALGDDLRNCLEGRPVAARRGNRIYRARKFAGRHRAGIAAAAIAGLAVVAGVIATAWEAREARARAAEAQEEKALAESRFRDARELAHAMLFDVHDAIENLPGATAAREVVLKRGLEYLDRLSSQAAGDPDLERELARGYLRLGTLQGGRLFVASANDLEGALASYRKGLALAEEANRTDPDSVDGLQVFEELSRGVGRALMKRADFPGAEVHLERAAALLARLSELHPDDLTTRFDRCVSEMELSGLLQWRGRFAEAERRLRNVDALARAGSSAWLSDRRSGYVRGIVASSLYLALFGQDRFAEALDSARQYLAVSRMFGAADPNNALIRRNMAIAKLQVGSAERSLGHLPEALTSENEAVSMLERLRAEDPKNDQTKADLASTLEVRSDIYLKLHDDARATADLEQASATYEALLGRDPSNAPYRSMLAELLVTRGDRESKKAGGAKAAREILDRALSLVDQDLHLAPDAFNDLESRARALSTLARLEPKSRAAHERALAAWRALEPAGPLSPSDREQLDEERAALRALGS